MSTVTLDRSLPAAIDAERGVLGAILANPDSYHAAADILKAEDFYVDHHRLIFRTMSRLQEIGQPIDLLTMQDEMLKQDTLREIEGIGYLAALTDGMPQLLNVAHYAKIIKGKALLRQTIGAANKIMAECFDGQDGPEEILDRAEQRIFDLAAKRIRTGFVRIRDMKLPAARLISKLYTDRDAITGLPTGFFDLDRMLSGLQPADLVIIAARPSMGKTALALNIAMNVGIRRGKTVGIFSLEMSKEQLLMRALCAESNADAHRVRSGYMSKEDRQGLEEALQAVSLAPIFIDDGSATTIAEMRAKCRKLASEHSLGLIVVDYLQLMSGGGSGRENRNQEITAISRGLKALAKDLNVPVIALSQLSRAPEQRQGAHRPQLSDLRESGSIEQDADVVLFIYREELYKPDEDNFGKAEILIAKQRNGPTGVVKLAFLKQYTKFENLMEL